MRIDLNSPSGQIPYFGNWLGAWAMNAAEFTALQQQIAALNITAHLAQHLPLAEEITLADEELLAADELHLADANSKYELSIVNGIAILNIGGTMMKHASSFSSGTSTVRARRMVLQAKRDPTVNGLMLKIDSPGGTVAGTMELGEAIKGFGKPTATFGCDLMASAAYWVGSQADEISASQMTSVGGIGTYTYVFDASGAFEEAGVKVHVIKAGEFKGAGLPGTAIEQKHLDHIQKTIDAINDHFVEAVRKGRGMKRSQVDDLADGRTHLADDALDMKLVDRVETFESAFEAFEKRLYGRKAKSRATASSPPVSSTVDDKVTTTADDSASTSTGDQTMSALTLQELRDQFPASSAGWRESMLLQGADLATATKSFADLQTARAEAAEAKLAEEQKAHEATKKRPGADPVKTGGGSAGGSYEGDAMQDWSRAVSDAMKETSGDRMRALQLANKRNPGLRQAAVEQHNVAQHRPTRMPYVNDQ